MNKNFQGWHKKKESLHNEKERPFFHEGEVWFCALGVNIGFEQDGKGESFLRPILIVKKFNSEVCWGLALTKHKKTGRYYVPVILKDKSSTVILSQIRLIDTKRLFYKMALVVKDDLSEIRKRLRQLLE